MYKGEWKEGSQHGEGLFINDRGEQRRGLWKNGVKAWWLE